MDLVSFPISSADIILLPRVYVEWLLHLFCRKLKKLFRKLKDETEPGESDPDHSKRPEQWDLDYSLEPYTGLTPEYMEMSKSPSSFLWWQVRWDCGGESGKD